MTPWHTLKRRVLREEEMDAADLDAAHYAAVLRDLGRVNRVTLAARPTLAFVQRAAQAKGRVQADNAPVTLKILDVGFGDGGMLRAIAALAARDHFTVELVGIDLNARSATVAAAATPPDAPIRWLTGDYHDLAGQDWDIILSSLVTHHMSDAERDDFLRFMAKEARIGWFINDLHRHRLAFAGYPLLATLLRADPIVRRDGQLSIARSFRPAEWHAMLSKAGITGADVRRVFPYRLCVAHLT